MALLASEFSEIIASLHESQSVDLSDFGVLDIAQLADALRAKIDTRLHARRCISRIILRVAFGKYIVRNDSLMRTNILVNTLFELLDLGVVHRSVLVVNERRKNTSRRVLVLLRRRLLQ